jgi:MATE family multidrug resistance protein
LSSYLDETRHLSRIAGPLILSSLVSMGVSIIDLVMMSWLGPESLAAGAVVSDYYSVFFYFFVGIIAAVSPLISNALGAQDFNRVQSITLNGFSLVAVSGAAGLVILWHTDIGLRLIGIDNTLIELGRPYGQMMGFTFIAMLVVNLLHYFLSAHGKTNGIFYASLFALPLNALGNYILMFGHFGVPGLGLAGAGLASLLAACFMVVFLLGVVANNGYLQRYRFFQRSGFAFHQLRDIVRIGAPIGVSYLGEMGVFLLATVLMGRFGPEAVAAHVVALRLAGVIYAVPFGYAQAAAVRIAFEAGANQLQKMLVVFKTALFLSFAVGLLYLILIGLFRSDISLLFLAADETNRDIILQASLFLLIVALVQPFDCFATVGSGVLRGFKDTRSIMIYSVIAFWGVSFLGGVTLAFYLGMAGTGLWLGLAGGVGVFGLLIAVRLIYQWRQVSLWAGYPW